jgi:hypothetical protein
MTILMEDPRASGAPGIEPRWTHSAKDVRSTVDGVVFDLIPEVAERYGESKPRSPIEIWKKESEDSLRCAALQTAHPRAGALYSALEQGRMAPYPGQSFEPYRLGREFRRYRGQHRRSDPSSPGASQQATRSLTFPIPSPKLKQPVSGSSPVPIRATNGVRP